VFAYPSELEAWKGSRELRLNVPLPLTPWRRAVSAVGFAVAMLLALVTMASGPIRTRSTAATENMNMPKFKKIRIPTKLSMLGLGALSPDGGRFAFASEGSIWVVPVHGKVDPDISGEPLKLTESMPDWVVLPTWSGDGKWIAFNHIDEDHGSIYVVPSAGGQTKKIPIETYGSAYLYNGRLSLSPDGKLLAFASTGKQEKGKREALRIYTIPVEGGAATRLTDSWTREPAFSPDGTKLAYVKVRELGPREERTDVWVMPVQGGTPIQVAEVPNYAANPVWSPHGKMIAFLTSPDHRGSGSKELWIVPVSERGGPVAAPTKIGLPNAAHDLPAGWTPENKIALFFPSPHHQAIYTVPASGGKATQVTPSGIPSHPRWSPDGTRIYLRWGIGELASVPAGGGEPSLIPKPSDPMLIEASPGGGNAISPDGKKIVFSGGHKGLEGVPIWTIPVGGGEPTRLTTPPTDNRFPCWSPDGNTIAFISHRKNEENIFLSHIYTIPAEGGEVRQLTSESDRVAWSTIAWSPDGKLLAYFSKETIKIIPAAGGESRDVVNIGPTNPHSGLAWSPDSTRLAYTSKGSIWVATLDGGTPTEVKTGLDAGAFHMAWSPDGEKLAFSAAKGGWEEPELWLMEDFLPLLKASK
jgi:Tol biopolymer transport system component